MKKKKKKKTHTQRGHKSTSRRIPSTFRASRSFFHVHLYLFLQWKIVSKLDVFSTLFLRSNQWELLWSRVTRKWRKCPWSRSKQRRRRKWRLSCDTTWIKMLVRLRKWRACLSWLQMQNQLFLFPMGIFHLELTIPKVPMTMQMTLRMCTQEPPPPPRIPSLVIPLFSIVSPRSLQLLAAIYN